MPAPVVVQFLLQGMPQVQNAFRTVEQAAAASERSQTAVRARGAQQRTSTADREARDKIRAMLKTDAEVKRIYDREVRIAATAAKQRVAGEERAEREMIRAADRAANEKMRIARHVDREFAAMQKRRAAESDRIIRDDDRRQEQSAKNRNRIRERSATMAGRYASQEANKEIHAREQSRQHFARAAYGGLATGVNRVGRGVGAAAGMLSQLGGGFSIADSVKEVGELQKSAVMFSNSAYLGKGSRIDPKQLQAQAKAASISTGVDPNELMKGAHAFLAKTGNAGEAQASMKLFGDIATGTGADVGDVAKAAGTLRVQNSDLDAKAMKSILLQTVRQGQKGSIEFSDLAGSIGKITRTASGYTGNQANTQAELLGLGQLGMATMSDPRDVATSLAGVESDTKKHWKKMQAVMGPDTFDNMGRITKGPSEFIAGVMEKSGGDTRKLQEMGFGKQSMKYFQALAPEFQKAGGGAEGKSALLTKMKDAVASPMGDAELQENVQNILNTSAKQFETAMTQLKIAVGEQLLPELTKLAPILRDALPTITRVVEGLVRLADWAASNPFAAVGAVLALSVGEAVAKAAIAKTIENALATSLGANLGKAGLIVGTAAIAVQAGMIAIDKEFKSEDKLRENVQKDVTRGAELTKRINNGTATPEEKVEAGLLVGTLKSDKAAQLKDQADPSMLRTVLSGAASVTEGGRTAIADEKAQQDRAIGETSTTTDKLIAALTANTAATMASTAAGGAGAGAPGGGPAGKPPAASTGIVQRTK